MIVAFWNINTGITSSDDRKNMLTRWAAEVNPDLIFFEEISSTLLPQPIERLLPAYKLLDYVNTLDKNFENSTKCLAALVKTVHPQSNRIPARPLTFSNLAAIRMAIKVNVPSKGDGFSIWSFHANSSPAGGRAACQAVADYLGTEAGKTVIVGGDFNYGLGESARMDMTTIAPIGYPVGLQAPPLKSTQWTKEYGKRTEAGVLTNMRLPPKWHPVLTVVPHRVIDYVCVSKSRPVTWPVHSMPNCLSQEIWSEIVVNFDHAPVVYRV